MDEGAWGRLTSTIPPLTPPAWTTSVTGQNPGKHNVFDFTRPSELVFAQSAYRHPFIDSSDRKAKSVWEYLNDAGYSAGVITFPTGYPPTPIQGYMLSEPWSVENEYQTSPPELLAEIADAVPGWFARRPLHELPEGDYAALEQKLQFDLLSRFEVLRYLLRYHPTDLTFIVFPEIDTAQHCFWRFMDKTHPHYEPSPFRSAILRFYQQVDDMLEQLLDMMSADLRLVVYSDHGFGPLVEEVIINRWLIENGFLTLKKNASPRKPLINRVLLGRIARRLGLRWLTRRIPDRVKSRIPTFTGEFEAIDWERTRVYFSSAASQSLMLNRRGREPWGIVSPEREWERIREEVITGLKSLKHPETGQSIVAQVYRPEEIYHGPYVSHAPDIIVQCAPGYQLQHGFNAPVIQSAQRSPGSRSGIHAPEGMALLWGAGIKSAVPFHARIADIAPTVLHAFGLSVPDMDGRVLDELFDSPALVAAGSSSPYSPEQERKITERLQRLGYL